MTADVRMRAVVDDLNRRHEPDVDVFVDAEALACYASMNRDALVTFRAAFVLDRERPDAALRTIAFCDARIALIDRLLRVQEETMPFTPEQLDDQFMYHAPEPAQLAHYQAIRAKARELAQVLIEHTPVCADQTAAVRKLREAVMTANAAVALAGRGQMPGREAVERAIGVVFSLRSMHVVSIALNFLCVGLNLGALLFAAPGTSVLPATAGVAVNSGVAYWIALLSAREARRAAKASIEREMLERISATKQAECEVQREILRRLGSADEIHVTAGVGPALGRAH